MVVYRSTWVLAGTCRYHGRSGSVLAPLPDTAPCRGRDEQQQHAWLSPGRVPFGLPNSLVRRHAARGSLIAAPPAPAAYEHLGYTAVPQVALTPYRSSDYAGVCLYSNVLGLPAATAL